MIASADQIRTWRLLEFWVEFILLAAVACSMLYHAVTLPRLLNYPHAWVTADNALKARHFAEYGFIASRGVPVNNNPPYGVKAAAYIHWPPLFPAALALWYRTFGDSESSTHAFMLLLQLATIAGLYCLVRCVLGRLSGAFAALAWVAFPGNLTYSHAAFHVHSAVLLTIVITAIAVWTFEDAAGSRRWWLCALAAAVGVLCTWETIFAPCGLLVAAYLAADKRARGRALTCLAVAAVTGAAVIAWYLWNCPQFASETLQTLLYRLGLSSVYTTLAIYNQGGQDGYLSMIARFRMEVDNLLGYVGDLGLVATAAYVVTEVDNFKWGANARRITAFLGLATPWVAWFVLFSNHAAIHDFMSALSAPAVAFAVAWAFVTALAYFAGQQVLGRSRFVVLGFLAPVVLLVPPLLQCKRAVVKVKPDGSRYYSLQADSSLMRFDESINFGNSIAASTPPGSVVLTSVWSLVPIYYSRRHTVRGIEEDKDVRAALPVLRSLFPREQFYLAVNSNERDNFPGTLAVHPHRDGPGKLLLIDLNGAPQTQ